MNFVAEGDRMHLLSNSWVTGIGGGLISGFLVYFATTFFASRKANKEYWVNLERAKSELRLILRTMVAEKQLPTPAILEAIVRSTARKYGVENHLPKCVEDVFDDIIKEITENSFLNAEQKLSFCDLINEIRPEYLYHQYLAEKHDYKADLSMSKILGRALALATVSLIGFATWLLSNETVTKEVQGGELPVLIGTVTVMMMTISLLSVLTKDNPSNILRRISRVAIPSFFKSKSEKKDIE